MQVLISKTGLLNETFFVLALNKSGKSKKHTHNGTEEIQENNDEDYNVLDYDEGSEDEDIVSQQTSTPSTDKTKSSSKLEQQKSVWENGKGGILLFTKLYSFRYILQFIDIR